MAKVSPRSEARIRDLCPQPKKGKAHISRVLKRPSSSKEPVKRRDVAYEWFEDTAEPHTDIVLQSLDVV